MVYAGFRQLFGHLIRGKTGRILGEENLPSRPPFIVVANHQGYIDPLSLVFFFYDRYQKPVYFITTKGQWRWWGKFLARHWLCMIPLQDDRKDRRAEALEEAADLLKKGEIVGLFPEGTRNRDRNNLLKGKTGAVRLAISTQVPILPVGLINNTGRTLINLLGSLFNSDRHIDIIIGQPFELEKYYGQNLDKSKLEEATRQVMEVIAKLSHKNYPY